LLTRVITDAIVEGLKARTTTTSADVKPVEAATAETATAELESALLNSAAPVAPAETPEA
jgi:small subunit ribosomal protein S2